MCGRYAMYGPQSRYRGQFGINDFTFEPRYNVTPSLVMPVIRQERDGSRYAVPAKWGLVPYWIKEPAQAQHPINAKAETAAIKPMFRDAFRRSRVLVPADGFYEWLAAGRRKQPYFVRMRDEAPFGMAGLIERWLGPDGELMTFTILTTDANPLVARIHGRMPAIIKPEDYGAWLDPALNDVEALQAMLGPYPERLMEAFAVSAKVSDPANEGPELVARLDPVG